jgi:hypothetical protein
MAVEIECSIGGTQEERKPFWAKCDECAHCWPAAYLPIELGKIGKMLKGLHCPMCGAPSKNLRIAKQDNGVLKEAIAP